MSPKDCQILFADLQPPIVARSKTTSPKELAASAGVLAKVAALLGLPQTFSVVPEGGKEPKLIPELAEHATAVFPRMTANPFLDAKATAALALSGRKTLVIAGFATEVVTLHAALSAIAAGYEVWVPVDANGGMSARTEDAALREIERAGGYPTSVVSLATKLAPDFGSSPGKDVFAVLQELRLA